MVSAMMIFPRLAMSSDGDYENMFSRPVGFSKETEEKWKARWGHAQMGHEAALGAVERETHHDSKQRRLSLWRGKDAGGGYTRGITE